MHKMSVRMLALTASVAFAACGDSTDLAMGELSQAEAEELAGAVAFATFNSSGDMPQQPAMGMDGPQAVPFEFSSDFEADVQCPLGGTVAVSASLIVTGDTETEVGAVSYNMGQVHDGCAAMSDDGTQFTLWGAPALELSFMVTSDGDGLVEWDGAIEGAVDWMSGDREGMCTVDLEFSGSREGDAAVNATLTGSICNRQITKTLLIGDSAS